VAALAGRRGLRLLGSRCAAAPRRCGGRSRRKRRFSAEVWRQLRYKTGWHGSILVEADRFFPSSKTCRRCGGVQTIGWAEHWTCDGCGRRHQRDDNATINLARHALEATHEV